MFCTDSSKTEKTIPDHIKYKANEKAYEAIGEFLGKEWDKVIARVKRSRKEAEGW